MKFVAVADDEQWDALTAAGAGAEWIRATENFSFHQHENADAFFILQPGMALNYSETTVPVFINSVCDTLAELHTLQQVLRINGWPGFLQRPAWEIAGALDDNITAIAMQLNKKFILVKDEPGLIAAKIIAMIINEAYFALGDEVSTKAEIDTAMKLGTNYPFGPFEWADKIGLKNIFSLLHKLSVQDKRYQPATALVNAIQNS